MSKNYATKPTIIDGVLKEWGDRLYWDEETRGRAGRKQSNKRNIFGRSLQRNNFSASGGGKTALHVRRQLYLTAKGSPEVMVKITGSSHNTASFKRHLDYISRGGLIALEDKYGGQYEGKGATADIRNEWSRGGYPLPKMGTMVKGKMKREVLHVILSMPKDTDPKGVTEAVRNFAAKTFPKHMYVMALHDGTENDHLQGRADGTNVKGKAKNPHVHLCVKVVDDDGCRLNPRKADLQKWRETFAESLREQGIEANATPRDYRGVQRYPVKDVQKKIRQGVSTKELPTTPHYDLNIEGRGRVVVKGYTTIADVLRRSDDKSDQLLARMMDRFIIENNMSAGQGQKDNPQSGQNQKTKDGKNDGRYVDFER